MRQNLTMIAALVLAACGREGGGPTATPTATSTSISTSLPTSTATPIPTPTPTSTATATPTACDRRCTGAVSPSLGEALANIAKKSRACYERELAKDAQIAGKLVVEVKIDEAGGLCSVDIASAEASLKNVSACTKKAFEEAKTLPPPEGGCILARVPIAYVQAPRDAGKD